MVNSGWCIVNGVRWTGIRRLMVEVVISFRKLCIFAASWFFDKKADNQCNIVIVNLICCLDCEREKDFDSGREGQ